MIVQATFARLCFYWHAWVFVSALLFCSGSLAEEYPIASATLDTGRNIIGQASIENGKVHLFVYWSQAVLSFPSNRITRLVPATSAEEAVQWLSPQASVDGRLRYLMVVADVFPGEPTVWQALMMQAVSDAFGKVSLNRDADRLLEQAEKYIPDDPEVRLFRKRQSVLKARLKREIEAYGLVLEISPKNVFARFQRGRMRFRMADEAGARDDFLCLLGPDFGHLRTEEMAALIQGSLVETSRGSYEPEVPAEWQEVEKGPQQVLKTRMLRIHHCQGIIARKIAEVMPVMYETITQTLGMPPKAAYCNTLLNLHLHPSKEVFQKKMGMALATGRTIGTDTIHTYQTVPGLMDKVLPHELTHIVLNRALDSVIARWATEGLAVRAENGSAYYYVQLVEQLAKGRTLDLEFLLQNKRGMDPFYYAQAYTFTDFLIAIDGWERFKKYLIAYAEHPDPGLVVQWYGFQNKQELADAWQDYLTSPIE